MARDVALFVTCLVDFFRPSVGFATVKLLEDQGCRVAVPAAQTCCGQPAYNAGDRADARAIAARVIEAFADAEAVVVPSGSCAGMLREHYPDLFADDPDMAARARDLAGRTHELVSFLTDVLGVTHLDARFEGVVTYHDSCSSLRELGVSDQARTLLGAVAGLELRQLAGSEQCCGFGGTFCVKYADISVEMVQRKVAAIVATGADTVLAGDLGCLLNIAGRLSRESSPIAARHIAEVLAGMTETPALAGTGERGG